MSPIGLQDCKIGMAHDDLSSMLKCVIAGPIKANLQDCSDVIVDLCSCMIESHKIQVPAEDFITQTRAQQ